MRTLLPCSILVALWAMVDLSNAAAACGGCQAGADDWEAACYKSIKHTKKVKFTTCKRSWWRTRCSDYFKIKDYYTVGSASCCKNYLLKDELCLKNGCGGCSGNSNKQRACGDRVTYTYKQSYQHNTKCGWWNTRRCASTRYRTKTSTRTEYKCCSGYKLSGSYCIKSTTTPPSGACGISKYSNAGIADKSISVAIVGGKYARPNEFPWQVSLRRSGSNSLFCGGTIIGSRHILTAAHCVRGVSSFRVYVGDHRLSSTESTQRIHSVASRTVHQSYSSTTLANDVAIIRLTTPISFNADIKPACLPKSSSKSYVNRYVIISGWGRTSTNGPLSDTLKYASVRVASAAYCREYYGDKGASVLCVTDNTGDDDKSSCNGDSGGPMVVNEPDGKWYVVGVTSFGSAVVGCAGGWPFGYQNVAYHLDWIKSKMN